jgi:hypothetical protein
MKHSFSDYDPPKNTGLSWDTTDGTNPAAELSEIKSELNGFYHEVFQPVWQVLSHTVSTLMTEWLSCGLNALGQGVDWLNTQAKASQTNKKRLIPVLKPAQSLTLESTLAVRKISGDLGKRGNNTLNQTEDQHSQAAMIITNPWLEAVKKQRCTLPIQSALTQQNKANKPQPRIKKRMTDEPNRGLDDIYTKPVSALFTEETDLTALKKTTSPWRKPALPTAPKVNTQTIAAMIDAELAQKPQPNKRMPLSASSKPAALAHRQAPVRRVPAAQSAEQRASQFDAIGSIGETFEHLQSSLYSDGPTHHRGHSVPCAEPQESEFIPGFTPKEAPIERVTLAEQEVRPQPVEALAPQAPSQGVQQTGSLVYPASSLLSTKAKAAHMDFKRQMPVYQEMKHEMTGVEHMARNNRILHNSISNLADSYFKKAAAEEAENS